jgi:hypothetical protein
MRKIVITEDEKREILAKHTNMQINEIVIFPQWLTPDDKYLILADNLIDIEEKKWYGNIWENFSNMIIFIDHLYEKSNFDPIIKENAKKVTSKLLLTESRMDMRPYLPEIKQMMIEEGLWDDFVGGVKKVGSSVVSGVKKVGSVVASGAKKVGDWAVDTAKATAKGLKDTAVAIGNGLYQVGSAIINGDLKQLWDLIKKGVVWAARKVRQALYSTVGMIVDAILVATGVGKAAQFVVWAIVVVLDIYELSTGDYEHPDDPMWMRLLFFGIDIFAMCTTGAAALPFIALLRGMRGLKAAAVSAKAAKPGMFRSFLTGLTKVFGKAASFVSKAIEKLKGSWITRPLGNWLSKIGAKLSTWIGKLKGSVDNLLSSGAKKIDAAATKLKAKPKVTMANVGKAALKATLMIGGIELAMHEAVDIYINYKINQQEPQISNTAKALGISKEELIAKIKDGTFEEFAKKKFAELDKQTQKDIKTAAEQQTETAQTVTSGNADYWDDAPPVGA